MSRASTGVFLALGITSVACGGKGDSVERSPIAAEGDDGRGDGVEMSDPQPISEGSTVATACGCASSPELQALSCGAEGEGLAISGSSGLVLTPSGDVAVFSVCYSSDGEVPSNYCRAFRWTRDGGTEALVDSGYHIGLADDGAALVISRQEDADETLLIERDGATARVPLNDTARLSANGRYVVGFVPEPFTSYGPGEIVPASARNSRSLARWSVADGLETLAELPDELFDGAAFDVAADASAIVGTAYDSSDDSVPRVSVMYTSRQGLRRIDGAPSGEGLLTFASRDGSAFSGLASSGPNNERAEVYYWTEAGGYRSVTAANPVGGVAFYQALSDDGLVVAGTGWPLDAGRHRVFRWTAAGLTWLGPDDAASRIADMTADGRLVLGTLIDTDQGFIASPGETRLLADLLASAAIDATGWELKKPLRISDDGKVVFGAALCGGVPALYRWALPE